MMDIAKKRHGSNIDSNHARFGFRFRMIGLNHFEKSIWERKLASVPGEWFLRKTNDYVYLCDINRHVTAENLMELLNSNPIQFEHGICISLVTNLSNGGLRLPPFVSEFYQSLGGTIDFSFVCGMSRRKVRFMREKHLEVNIVSGHAESTVAFYIEGLNSVERLQWEQKLAPANCEWHYIPRLKSYGCLYRMQNSMMTRKLEVLLGDAPIPFDHGIRVSIVTDRDNDGLRLASFVADFYRHFGGTIDFTLACGS